MKLNLWPATKITIFLLIVGTLSYLVSWKETLAALAQVSFKDIIKLTFISFLLVYVSVLKWQLLLAKIGSNISIFKLFKYYLLGYFFNSFLPSLAAGDVFRSYTLGKEIGFKNAALATFLERYTGFFIILFLGSILGWFNNNIEQSFKVIILLLFLSQFIFIYFLSSEKFLQISQSLLFFKSLVNFEKIENLQKAYLLILKDKKVLLLALIYSMAFFVFAVVNTQWAGDAVGWESAEFIAVGTVLPLIFILNSLPLTPSGIGVQEGVFYFFLKSIGATSSQALSVALVLRIKWLILAMLGGIIWLINLDKNKQKN
jgi:glycosyltransferase 2 family protein